MKPNRLTGPLLYMAIFTACNGKPEKAVPATSVPESSRPQQTAAAAPAADTTFLSEVTPFTANETNTVFTAPGGWEVTDFESGSRMTVRINGKPAGSINFSNQPYDGPGFAVYHYAKPDNGGRSILLVEAQADPGSAWYCAAIIENNRIVRQLFIDEPRSNSEIHALSSFITIFETGGSYIFRFNKKLIADYSKVPAGLVQDAEFVYIPILDNK